MATDCPQEVMPWPLRTNLITNRPLSIYKLLLKFTKEDSEVPVWLRMQLWESIPDPHHNKIAIWFASDDEEDLQLLTRLLSMDIGAGVGQRSCITTFP